MIVSELRILSKSDIRTLAKKTKAQHSMVVG